MSKFKHEVQDFHPVIESLIIKSGWEPIGEVLNHRYGRYFYDDMIFWPKFLIYFNKELQREGIDYLVSINDDFFASLRNQILNKINEKGFLQFLKQKMRVVLPDGKEFYFYPVDKDWKRNVFNYKKELSLSKERDGSIDFAWVINGFIPVDNEVKLDVEGRKSAEKQYKERPQNHAFFKFNNRSIVHFASDESSVSFATEINTGVFFLPFNKHATNPDAEPFNSAYLYSEFITPENIVRLIHEFCFTHKKDKKDILVFPRYHQFRDVLDLSSKHYKDELKTELDNSPVLSQHAPGAGKTYKEIWDGYQAIVNNQYQKSILAANSKKLVQQLFDEGMAFMSSFAPEDRIKFVYADEPLKDVLENNNGRVIICSTLQKFNQTSQDSLSQYQDQNFFISIDEETGTGGTNQSIATGLAGNTEEIGSEDTDKFHETYKKMRAAKNLKFSCNTGTPSDETLDLFGKEDENGSKKAHYYYSMEQSLKEGFTVYPLQNFINIFPEYVAKALNPSKQVHQLIVDAEVKKQIALQLQNPEMREDRLQEIVKNLKVLKKKGHVQAVMHAVSSVQEANAVTEWLQKNGPSWLKVCVDYNVTNETQENLENLNKDLLTKYSTQANVNTIGDFFKKRTEYNYMVVVNKNLIGYSNDRVNIIILDRVLSTYEVIVQVISRANRKDIWEKVTYVMDTCNQQERIEKAMAKYYSAQSVLKTSLKRIEEILGVFKTNFKSNSSFIKYLSSGDPIVDDSSIKLMAMELVNDEAQNSAIRLLVQYRSLCEDVNEKGEELTKELSRFYEFSLKLINELIPHKKETIKYEDVSKDLEIKVLGYSSEETSFEMPEIKNNPVKLDNPQEPEFKELKKALEKHNIQEEYSEEEKIKMLPLYKNLKIKGLSPEQMSSAMVLIINCTKGDSRKVIVSNKDPKKIQEQIKRQVFVHTLKDKELKKKLFDDSLMLNEFVEVVGKLAVGRSSF